MAGIIEAEVDALKTIYGPGALYVDSVKGNRGKVFVTPDRVGKVWELIIDGSFGDTFERSVSAYFVAKEEHAVGHFKPESGLPLIVPGHKLIRAVVAATVDMVDILNNQDPTEGNYKRMVGFDRVAFMQPVVPGHTTEIDAYFKKKEDGSSYIDAEVTVGKKPHMIIEGLMVRDEPWPEAPVLLEDQIVEFAAQSALAGLLKDNPGKLPLFTGIGRARFSGRNITTGSILIATLGEANMDGKRGFSCSSEVVDEDGWMVAEIENIRLIGLS